MNPSDKQKAALALLPDSTIPPVNKQAAAWASVNIALCKYWGKRDEVLNLPFSDSLSVLLPKHGVQTQLDLAHNTTSIIINGMELDKNSTPHQQLTAFLGLFPHFPTDSFKVTMDYNIPVAAGFASSAACYASLVRAVNDLFAWELPDTALSALARLGSGSACRSFSTGFSRWHAGTEALGTDSFATPINARWDDLRIGLISLCDDKKPISSREGMRITKETSPLFFPWHQTIPTTITELLDSIQKKDFERFGQLCEQNALGMHATMLSAWPPVCYTLPETRALQQSIWDMRRDGKFIYFTQDAGPNLKLLFLKDDEQWLTKKFPAMQTVIPFIKDSA